MRKQVFIIVLCSILVGLSVMAILFEKNVFSAPENHGSDSILFSDDSGFFEESFYLELTSEYENCTIRYTLDDSNPTYTSKAYESPILIEPVYNHDFEDSSANYAQDATIVKACCFIGENPIGGIETNTYFVHPSGKSLFKLPVLSLTSDKDNLFSLRSGIYLEGGLYGFLQEYKDVTYSEKQKVTNYYQRGDAWEKDCNIEYFEEGILKYEKSLGMRIFGGASREEKKKSFALFTDGFSDTAIDFPFFENLYDINGSKITSFSEIILRSGGTLSTEFSSIDSINSEIAGEFLDSQDSKPIIVFINGTYFGVYYLRESMSEDYIKNHYGIEPEDIEMVETLKIDTHEENNTYYQSLIDFAQKNDLGIRENFEYIQSKVDLENMLEYFVFNMYIGNTDWPAANNKVWRVYKNNSDYSCPESDGKYRYVLYDTDAGMNYRGDFRFDELHPTIFHWVFDNKYPNYKKLNIQSLIIFNALMENKEFENRFFNKFCDRVNKNYTSQVFNDTAQKWSDIISPEIEGNMRRYSLWKGNTQHWQELLDTYKQYVTDRNSKIFSELADYFERSVATLEILHSEGGLVNINGNIEAAQDTDFIGKYISEVPITLIPVPFEGYEFEGWSDGSEEEVKTIVFGENDTAVTYKAIFKEKSP